MIYFLETDIPNNKKLKKSLENVFGLGKNKSILFVKIRDFKKFKTSDLTGDKSTQIIQNILNSNILITNNLKKENSLSNQNLVNIKSIRGLRKKKVYLLEDKELIPMLEILENFVI